MAKQKQEEQAEIKKSTGGSEIEVKTEPVLVPQAGGAEGDGKPPEPSAGMETNLVNEALVETIVRVLGKTLALVTKIPEMDFDELEMEQLKSLWSPLIPSFSPVAMAAIGTVVIAGGKVGLYMSKRPKGVKGMVTTESKGTKKEAASIEEKLEAEFRTQ